MFYTFRTGPDNSQGQADLFFFVFPQFHYTGFRKTKSLLDALPRQREMLSHVTFTSGSADEFLRSEKPASQHSLLAKRRDLTGDLRSPTLHAADAKSCGENTFSPHEYGYCAYCMYECRKQKLPVPHSDSNRVTEREAGGLLIT